MNKIINNIQFAYKIKLIAVIVMVIIFSIAGKVEAMPKIYVSGGVMLGSSAIKSGKIENNTNNFSINENFHTDNGFMLSTGVAPNLPIPVIGGLRAELQYIQNYNNSVKGSMFGVGIYYDVLKIIPIITPYIGTSLMYYNANTSYALNSSNSNQEVRLRNSSIKQPVISFNAGFNVDIPLLPVTAFAEYRYTTSGLFTSKFTANNDQGLAVKNGEYKSNAIVLGVRYNIL